MARAKRPDARQNAHARRRPLSDAERSQIVEAIRDGAARNEIARLFGRSPSTISKIAAGAGLRFDRAATQAATEAKRIDNAARRAELAEGMLDDALRLRSQMFAPSHLYNFNKDGDFDLAEIREPTFADKRNIAVAVKVLADGACALEAIDASTEDIDRVRGAILDIQDHARHRLGRPPIERHREGR